MTARTFSTACFALCAFSILLLFLPHPAKAQNAPTVTDLRVMEERVKALEEKVQFQQRELELRGSIARASIRIEAEVENKLLSQKIDFYLLAVLGISAIIGFVARLFGRQAIVKWVEKRTADQVTEYVKAQLQDQGKKAIDDLLKTLQEQAQTDLNTFLKIFETELEKLTTARRESETLTNEIRELIKGSSLDTPPTPEERQKLSDAAKALDETKSTAEYTADEWHLKGHTAYQNGDYESARDAMNKVIEFKPDDANAYNNRGLTYGEQQRYDEALNDYNKAIELKLDFAIAYNNRGNTYNSLKRYDEALNDYNKAIELKPDYARAYNSRGFTYDDLKRYDEALADYNKAIELKTDDALVYNNRGFTYQNQKRYDEALNDYNKAIELKPNLFSAHKNLAELYLIFHQFERVLEEAEFVLSQTSEQNHQAIGAYLKCLALRLLGRDTGEAEIQLSALLAQSFELTWSFQEIKTWVEEADLEPAVKQFIQEKTAMMEKYQRGEDLPSTDDA